MTGEATMTWQGRTYRVNLEELRGQLAQRMALEGLTVDQVAAEAGVDRVTMWRFLCKGQQIRERNARAIVLKAIRACWHDLVVQEGALRPIHCATCPAVQVCGGDPAKILVLPSLDDTSRTHVSSRQLVANTAAAAAAAVAVGTAAANAIGEAIGGGAASLVG